MSLNQEYQKSLDYLYSFVDFSLSKTIRYAEVEFELDRVCKLMDTLGNPQDQYPIIHVAGTKGKGSVSAFCSSAIHSAGYMVGLYTSPHMHDYTERIQINNNPIPKKDLIHLIEEIKPSVAKIPKLTTFEITTALGLLYFCKMKVDAAVIEVGLGGRLDATNITKPKVSVITSISYDHMYILGNTLTEIATEKAGIIKPGIPVVLSPQENEAKTVINNIANEQGSKVIQIGKDYLYALNSRSREVQTFFIWPVTEQPFVNEFIESGGKLEWEPIRITIPLLGYHQVENAATAYAALQEFKQSGIKINTDDIQKGFNETKWPGRFEILQNKPPVVIDCAHNRYSARKLRLALDDYYPGTPIIMVFGASEDKDIYGMFAELMPRVNNVIATRSYHPRAMEITQIVEMGYRFGHSVFQVADVADALDKAISLANNEAVVLVTGSIFIAAGAREAWFKRFRKK